LTEGGWREEDFEEVGHPEIKSKAKSRRTLLAFDLTLLA